MRMSPQNERDPTVREILGLLFRNSEEKRKEWLSLVKFSSEENAKVRILGNRREWRKVRVASQRRGRAGSPLKGLAFQPIKITCKRLKT